MNSARENGATFTLTNALQRPDNAWARQCLGQTMPGPDNACSWIGHFDNEVQVLRKSFKIPFLKTRT